MTYVICIIYVAVLSKWRYYLHGGIIAVAVLSPWRYYLSGQTNKQKNKQTLAPLYYRYRIYKLCINV